MVTPVRVSPLNNAWCTGAAPRYLGSREAWTFTLPNFGISSTASGIIWPNAATTIASGDICSTSSMNSSERTVSGWWTGTPASRATCFTGEALSSRLRPAGRSGRVTTPINLCLDPSSAFKVGTAKPAVPMNKTRILNAFLTCNTEHSTPNLERHARHPASESGRSKFNVQALIDPSGDSSVSSSVT